MIPFELRILRECAGQLPASPWGAAVGAAYEALIASGYLNRSGTVTQRGWDYLRENPL